MALHLVLYDLLSFVSWNRYAYAVSSALHDVGNILYKDFMIQVDWIIISFFVYDMSIPRFQLNEIFITFYILSIETITRFVDYTIYMQH